MPWEAAVGTFLTSYTATKILDKAVDAVIFNEKFKPGIFRKGIAERYLELDADQLFRFYRNEVPLEVLLAGKRYIVPMSVVFDASDGKAQDVSCLIATEEFSVSDTLIDYTKPVIEVLEKDSKSHHGRVVRLAAYNGDSIVLQEASYFEGVATNFAADHKPKGRNESLREMLHGPSGSFGDFENSPFVNHIGVVCMIETCDGLLIAQKRSRNVTNRRGSLSSSASGAVNWTDVRSKKSPFCFNELAESVFREALEELNTTSTDMVFLGLLREFLRAGKPEAYFFARSKDPFQVIQAKLRHAEDHKESKDIVGYELHSDRVGSDEFSRDGFKQRVRDLLHKTGDSGNITLEAGIILTARHILGAQR